MDIPVVTRPAPESTMRLLPDVVTPNAANARGREESKEMIDVQNCNILRQRYHWWDASHRDAGAFTYMYGRAVSVTPCIILNRVMCNLNGRSSCVNTWSCVVRIGETTSVADASALLHIAT